MVPNFCGKVCHDLGEGLLHMHNHHLQLEDVYPNSVQRVATLNTLKDTSHIMSAVVAFPLKTYRYTSLIPRLPCSRTQTLKLCRWGKPGIFFLT